MLKTERMKMCTANTVLELYQLLYSDTVVGFKTVFLKRASV